MSPNYLYVLPMIRGKLPGSQTATGKKLKIAADGQAVYDPVEKVTWLANANFAAGQTFGVANINPDGSMEHSTALLWVKAMNKGAGYLRSLRFTASV